MNQVEHCNREKLIQKLESGMMIVISGIVASNINNKLSEWCDFSGRQHMYVIITRVESSYDDYLALRNDATIHRLVNLTTCSTIDFL